MNSNRRRWSKQDQYEKSRAQYHGIQKGGTQIYLSPDFDVYSEALFDDEGNLIDGVQLAFMVVRDDA